MDPPSKIPGTNITVPSHATRFQIDLTYFVVLGTELFIPFLAIMIGTLYRKSLWANFDFTGRQQSYDIHVMRREDARTKLAKLSHIICYRHRPLPLEVLRTCFEVTVLLYLLGYVRLVILLPIWCICDLAQGLHVLSLVYLRHTQLSREAVRLATYIEIVYSLLFGFPLGFVSKLMWIVWVGSEISFPTIFVPMYIATVGAFVFTLCYMLPTLYWSAAANGCKRSLIRLNVILLLFCYCAMWMMVYYNVSVCESPPLDYSLEESRRHLVKETRCQHYFVSWTTAFLPLSIVFVMTLISLLAAILEKSILYRFLPEVAFLWSGTVVFVTSLYTADGASDKIQILPLVLVVLSVVLTIFINVVLMSDIISGLRAPVVRVHEMSNDQTRSDEDELKRRQEVRLKNLNDFSLEGGKTSLKGTLLMHLRKRDRMRQCVVCFDEFIKSTDPITEETEDGEEPAVKAGRAAASVLGIIRKCGHYFHFNCVWDWIQRENNCPLCRTVIDVTKDAIKTVQYDDVRYALERNSAYSTIGTVSKLVSEKNEKKSRPGVTDTLYKRGPRIEEPEEDTLEAEVMMTTNNSRIHPKPVSKHCGVCKKKFLPNRQSRDIVVGYIRSCGHYFHWDCVDRYVVNNERCPTCHATESRHLGEINEAMEEEDVHINIPNTSQHHQFGPRSGSNNNPPPMPSGSTRNNNGRSRSKHDRQHAGMSHHGRERPGREKSSRKRAQTESKRSGHTRHFHPGDSVRGLPMATPRDYAPRDHMTTRGHNGANHRAVAGPSAGRGHYKRNPRSNAAVSHRHNVRSDDIMFAFLSDVQRDVQRRNRRQQPSTIHAPSPNRPL